MQRGPEEVRHIARTFYEAVESNDLDLAETMLSPDIVYHSPAVHEPFRGSAVTATSIRAVFEVWDNFRWVRELTDESGAAMVWEATVDGAPITGCDVFRWDDQGQLVELVATVRPVGIAQDLVDRVLRKIIG